MNDAYFEMMKAGMKASGMSDEQIEAALNAQKASMQSMMNFAQGAQDLGAGMMEKLAGLNMDSYFEFADPSTLSPSDQWAVACGADLIHLRADIINDLTSGSDADLCKEMLAEQWGIKNKKQFMEMAESLMAGRHSKIYSQIAKGKVPEDFEDEAENFQEAMEQFAQDKLIKPGKAPDMAAWDLGRLINISRFAFDAKMISREEALDLIRKAALEMKKHYKSWKELSVAYQFGRAVWGGMDGSYEEMKEGMEQLLEEEDSPWVTLPFDMKLDFQA